MADVIINEEQPTTSNTAKGFVTGELCYIENKEAIAIVVTLTGGGQVFASLVDGGIYPPHTLGVYVQDTTKITLRNYRGDY